MDLQSMIDVTSFGRLAKYRDHDPGINQLIEVVDDRLTLVEVAESFVSGNNFQVKAWIKTGAIKPGTFLNKSMAVECIRLVPFYLFKKLKKRYE